MKKICIYERRIQLFSKKKILSYITTPVPNEPIRMFFLRFTLGLNLFLFFSKSEK